MADEKKKAYEELTKLVNDIVATGTVSKTPVSSTSARGASDNGSSGTVGKQSTSDYFASRRKALGFDRIKVTADYINSFLDDSQKYMHSTTSDKVRMGFGTSKSIYESRKKVSDDLHKRSFEISRFLDDNKDNLDGETYKSLKDYLDAFDRASSQSIHAFYRNNEFYSQFGSKEEYDKWLSYSTPERRKERYANNQARIDELQAERRQLQQNKPGMNPYSYGGAATIGIPYGAVQQGGATTSHQQPRTNGRLMEIEKEIAALETEMRMYERGNTDASGFYYGSKVIDDYSDLAGREDFKEVSSNRDFYNPGRDALSKYDSMSDSSTWYTDANNNIYDVFGNRIDPSNTDEKGNILHPYANNSEYAVTDRLGLYLNASAEEKLEAIGTAAGTEGTWESIIKDGYDGNWELLKKNEVDVYYYLLNSSGQEVADKYLSDMKIELNRRNMTQANNRYTTAFSEADTLERLAMSIASTPAQLFGGATAFIEDTAMNLMGKDINPYSAAHAGTNFSSTVRSNQAKAFDEATGGAAIPFINFTAGDFYQSGMSAFDMVIGANLGYGAYEVLMGMGAASTEAKRLYEQGASKEQIVWGGALAGGAEIVFEHASIESLINLKNADDLGQIVKNLLIQGGIEASEEGFTDIANTITNAIIMGSESDWAKLVKEHNGDRLAAFIAKVQDVGNTAFGGFVSGSMGGSTHSAATYAQTQAQNEEFGSYISGAESTDDLVALAQEMGKSASQSVQRNLAKQSERLDKNFLTEGGKNRAIGRLYNTVKSVVTEQNISEISTALQEKGISKKDATAIAGAIAVKANGMELTDKQQKVLDKFGDNENVQNVVNEILENKESGINQRARSVAKFEFDTMRNDIVSRMKQKTPGQENVSTANTEDAQKEHSFEVAYEASEDGKTIIKSTGETVDIKEVASIKDGQMTLKLTDDRIVNAKDISYASQSDALVYEAVANMGVNATAANVLVNAYHSDSGVAAEVYSLGIKEAYRYGQYSYPAQELAKGPFSSMLTEHQRNTAYKLGKMFGGKQVAKAQAIAEKSSQVANKNATVAKKVGKVHFDGDLNALTERQSASLSALETVADALGVQIYLFESKVGENGKRIGANGWFDTKDSSIHIDLHAGVNGEATMLFTAAHELTHFIKKWSPAKFKTLANFLMKEYGQKGVSVDEMVHKQIEKAKRTRDVDLTYDEAFEEVVADSMETMLADGNVVEKLAKLKQQDRSLWQKIKDYIGELAVKIRSVYERLTPDSQEGRYVAEMVDSIEKLQDLFTEGLVEASENYQASLIPGEEGVVVNQNGDPVAYSTEDGSVMLSMRTYEESGRNELRKYLQKCVSSNKLTKAEMQEMMDGIEEIYQVCKEFKDQYAPFSSWSDAAVVRDTYGRPVFSVVTPNGDYKMNLDFSLVCKKRRTLDAVFNEMSRRGIIDDFELGQKSVVKINEIIRKYGLETACALCFVDAKRFRQASMADQFTNLYNELVLSLVPEGQRSSIDYFNFSGYETIKKVNGGIDTWDNSKLDFSHLDEVMKNYGKGTVEHKAAKYIKSHPEGRKLLLRGDFMSSQGFDAVKTQNKDILKLYNSKKGTGGPKAAFGDVQYMNEIVKKARTWTPAKAYAVGGVRIQSFSDYVPRMVFDYTQMIYDLAATKLPAHAYTKEALFVKQFGLTGVKINMSLIPAIAEGGIAPGLDANGDYVWAGESFDYETAKEIQNAEGYTENCGTICVGVSKQHIEKLLRDPNIRMVIPYHKSGLNPIVAHMNKIAEFTDYTNEQRTKGKDGKAVSKDFDFSKALHDMGDQASPKAVADQYLKWCAANGYTAKFAEFAMEDNYYKLLEDFTLYDKDGNFVPQREVRAVFPKADSAFGSMKDLIQEGLQEDAMVEGKRDKNLSAIVDEIQRTIPKTEAEIAEEQVTQADRDLEAAEPADAGSKFSMRETVEETKDLLAYHNITAQLLQDVLNRNGLLMPSLAVTNKGMTDFGEISLLFDKSTIDPNANNSNKLYGADAWTPTQTKLKKNAKFDTDKTVRAVNSMKNKIGSKFVPELFNISPKQFKDTIIQADGSIYDAYAHDIGIQTAYAMEKGIITKIPVKKDGTLDRVALEKQLTKELDTDNGWRQYKRWLNNISDTVITSYDNATNQDILRNMKAQPATAKVFKLSETGELVVPAVEYSSIDEARSNKNRLSENAAEATKAVADEFLTFARSINGDVKSVVDSINAAFANRYSTADIVKTFNANGIKITSKDAGVLQSLYKKAVELPTQYFEAKPGREVGLNEIKAAVMPADSSYADLKGKLENLGISVVEYDGSNKSRVEALNSVESLKFSDRDTDSVSNRSLLANALESVAKNDIERKRLQEYKEKIGLINAEEKKLRELNLLLKAESDPKRMREIQFDAQQAANRINTYDRQLLRLEASRPLQDVLTREKKMAYDRGVQKGKEALEAYRVKAEKEQKETVKRYQESRERGVENRRKTAMRQKIRGVIRDLDKILNRGNKKSNVKEDMKDFVADALSSAEILFTDSYTNEDMVRNGVGTDLTPEEAKFMNEARAIMDELAHLPTGYDGWMARQEQEFKLKGRLNYRMSKLKNVFVRERARLNKTQVSEVLGNLADSYGRLQNSEYAHVQGAYHENVHEYLKMLQEDVGGTIVKDMTLGQLEELYKAYTMVMTTVRNANRMFAENLNNTRDALANRVMFEVHEAGGEHGLWSRPADKLNSFSWNNEKPVYAFERLGSKTLKTLYGNIRKGQDGWAVDIQEANDFRMEVYKKYKRNTWDTQKTYKFTSSSGMDFELNTDQIMSLYAYSKRSQAHDHLLKGGFVFDGNTEVVVNKKGLKLTYLNKNATAYNVSFEILEDIISKLTPEQKAFVDDMQEYLSNTMGEKGNEVSMQLYGVKLFNEKFYFPLRSAGQYMERAKEADLKKEQGQVNIANSGFSKAVKIKASNPVVLTGFMDVWAGHVNEMSMYHSFVLPMEDFRRVYNYSSPHMEGQPSASVNGVIQNAYGAAATDYIDQLYRDLNGGALTDNRTGPINKLMGLFKKGAVFASASVTAQQPSAIARATALVDIKHFFGPRVDAKRHKALWEEVKKYAPVAVIKEMGFFDTNMGRSATDFLTAEEYSDIKEKAKALVKDESYRDEMLSKAPALADELTWCAIWEAVKRETKARNPEMDAKSEEFLTLAGDRFSEVIDKTQVYDSVLARSANMRSKDTGMKMATAFMAEPTTSINMVADALRKGKKGNKKQAARIVGSVVSSVILNSFLVAWVYAARDDDEDETFREKYLSAFLSGIKDGVNPATYIPFVKDVVSIMQGYDVERSDMAVISDLWSAYQKLGRDDVSAWMKVEGFVGSICQIFGLPVKNIMRDVRSVFQAYDTIVNGEKNTTRGTAYAIVEGLTGQKDSNPEQLYKARKAGDEEHAARVEARYDDEKSANAAARNAITDRYMDGDLTLAQATMELSQYAGMKPDEAYWLMDGWKHKKETGSDDDYNKYNAFYEAVKTGKDLKAVIKNYTDNGVKTKTLSSQITDHFKDQYVEMSVSERASIKGYLINAYEQCGVSRENAEEKLREWDFEAKYGGSYNDIVDNYKNGKVSEETMRNILAERGNSKSEIEDKISDWNAYKIYGYDYSKLDDAYRAGEITREEFRQAMIDNGTFPAKADQAIITYDWMRDNAQYGLEYSDAGKYAHPIQNYGRSLSDVDLDPDMYLEYKEKKKECQGIDGDNDGKADSGTLRTAKFEMIDSLPITNDQKDALAAIDYGMKSIKKYAPWH